jgi:hypothetical protein
MRGPSQNLHSEFNLNTTFLLALQRRALFYFQWCRPMYWGNHLSPLAIPQTSKTDSQGSKRSKEGRRRTNPRQHRRLFLRSSSSLSPLSPDILLLSFLSSFFLSPTSWLPQAGAVMRGAGAPHPPLTAVIPRLNSGGG